jgi:dolichol kinase
MQSFIRRLHEGKSLKRVLAFFVIGWSGCSLLSAEEGAPTTSTTFVA